MSSTEFKLFEKLCNFHLHGTIIKDRDFLATHGFNWVTLQKLKEFGLISLDGSQRTVEVHPNATSSQFISDFSHIIIFKNNGTNSVSVDIPCYLFTSVANEILNVITVHTQDDMAIEVATEIKKISSKKGIEISLHKVTAQFGDQIFYNSNMDLLSNLPDSPSNAES